MIRHFLSMPSASATPSDPAQRPHRPPPLPSQFPIIGAESPIGGRLFRFADDGATWQRIDDNAHRFGWIYTVTGDARVFGRVYFATVGRGIIFGVPAE